MGGARVTETRPATEPRDRRQRRYEIGKPAEHATLSFFGPTRKPALHARERSHETLAPAESVEKRAIWIVHGMGQQVPFETLDSLAQGVLLAAKPGVHNPQGWHVAGPPRVASTKFLSVETPSKTQVVQRLEIDLHRDHGNPGKLELHLYEAYWAPLTEGVAKLSEVMSFLFDGGLHGLLNCTRPFRRAMFPDDQSPVISDTKEGKCDQGFWNFRIRPKVAIQIIAALLLVLALIGINAIIAAASAAHLKFPVLGPWPISDRWDQLTAIASAVTSLALSFATVLFLAEMSKPATPPAGARHAMVSLALGIQWLVLRIVSPFKAASDKPADRSEMAETTDPILNWSWSGAKWIIFWLSWISLVITAVAVVIGAVCLAGISWSSKAAGWFHGMHYHATQFVSTAAILVALALCVFAGRRRAVKRSQGIDHRKDGIPLLLFVSAFLLHSALLYLLVLVQFHRFFDPNTLPLWKRWAVTILGSPFWVWPALIAVSKLVRDIIVEYPGDVAIYVTPNKLDRFDEVRKKMKQLALDSLMPLYSACGVDSAGEPDPTAPLYSRVAVIGHSLGSVVAYDTLNKLLTLDELLHNQFDVAERTCIFETFGSPLDKTAFFFTFQGKDTLRIREQLAASVQPLIQSYVRFRKFPWINVHSPSDIISGGLKFYDVNPAESAVPPASFPVQNIPDRDAIVPLIAHVEYWKNPTIWLNLFCKVTT
jgi:hypothetical protein